MLILTRKPGESIYIGDIKVTIVEIKGHQIRVGIDAPPEVRIYREEIYVQIMEENRMAAETAEGGLEGIAAALKSPGGSADAPRVGGITKLKGASLGGSGREGNDESGKGRLGIHLPEVPKKGAGKPNSGNREGSKPPNDDGPGPEVFVKRRKKD